ncbi:TonB-dependent receptor [Longitalea arenae]|uniref:TonB-dependent receptor n=1 Tax=Longitalea arenae TaxID=2812558 RepID=UPI001F075A8C|nr:TonB-dependent receptor [Longitalea arenae]
MKLTIFFIAIAFFSAHAEGTAQNITISGRNLPLKTVFSAIEKQTGYVIFNNKRDLDESKTVTISAHNLPLKDVLDIILKDQPLEYSITGKTIVLSRRLPVISTDHPEIARIPITGTVVDAKGLPLDNVSVVIKGKNKVGTTTNASGEFRIEANEGDVLVFSIVGYLEQQVTVGKNTNVSITLTAIDAKLEEVVVVGYGTTKRRDLTGAVVSVKPDEITARPGPNPMESLQGRVAGLDITRSSGQPGAALNIQLRGNRSFTASGTPLFIINGLPGDYATLNPYDIESIEVLKDASSTAMYGSAGSNGVIIITTKSGKAGKLSIDLNTYYGYNGWSVTPKMRTGDAYLQTKRDAYSYVWDAANKQWTRTGALWQSEANDEAIFGAQRYATFQEGYFADWADLFLQKNAATQNYSIGVSGGNDKTKGYISFNYTDEKGQYFGDRYKLFASTMRIDHKVKNWITIGSSLQASYVDRDKAQDKLENALVTDPLARPYKADGTLNPDLGNNVYNLLLNNQPGVYGNVDNNLRLYVNPYVEIRPLKGLSFLSRLSTWLNFSNTYRFDGIGSVNYTYANAGIARAYVDQNRQTGYQWENILTYNFKVANDHAFTLTGITSWYDNSNTNTSMTQSNILSNNFKWYKFTGDVNTTATSEYTMSKTLGFIGRLNYSYRGKYLLQASVRRDGSSVLYKDNQWDNFPAVSVGWRISDESFMDGATSWLNNLKLRVGWGITGTAKINPYSSVNNLESTNMSLGGVTQPIYRQSQFITNPELGWEKSYNTNIGVDAAFLKNRIDVSLDLYDTKTKGVIYSVTAPIIYGTYRPGTQYQTNLNVCETQNRGIELALNTRNVVTKDFTWNSSVAFSYNKEKILRLTGGVANNIANDVYSLTIGQPVRSFRNYKLDGVWQIGEENDAAVFNKRPGDLKVNVPGMTRLGEGVYTKTAADGTVNYYYNDLAEAQKYNPALVDATRRYTYSANDYQILGHNTPDWSLGFQNSFSYKNFDLTIYSYFRWGQMISYNMMGWYQPNSFATNASPSRTIPEHFNYWTPTNPTNDFPMMNYLETSSTMTGFSGLNFVDGSFFKIKNITLGYTLPKALINRMSIERFRLYGTVTNPLIIARSHYLKNYDPEMNGSLEYPLTKQIVVGLNVTL